VNGGGNLPVGPGIWGFLAFFVLAIALWLLVRNMNSRLRRMAYTDRERAEAAEAAAREREADGTSSMATDVAPASDTRAAPDVVHEAAPDGVPHAGDATDAAAGEPGDEDPSPRA